MSVILQRNNKRLAVDKVRYFSDCLSNIASTCETKQNNGTYSGNNLIEHIHLASNITMNYINKYQNVNSIESTNELIAKTAFVIADKLLNDEYVEVNHILSTENTQHTFKEFVYMEAQMLNCIQYLTILNQNHCNDMFTH